MRSLIALLSPHLSANPNELSHPLRSGASAASAAFLFVRCLSNTQLRLVPRGPPAVGRDQAGRIALPK